MNTVNDELATVPRPDTDGVPSAAAGIDAQGVDGMHHTAVVDPYLDIALDGVQLIEASAGTGKTFTLATLVTRLVVERGLRLGQILAVTFTEAATQELRARLRKRLAKAAAVARALAVGTESLTGPMAADDRASAVDPDRRRGAGAVGEGKGAGEPAGADDAETALTRAIIQRQLQREDATALFARLQRAEHEVDLAAVFTIHGFCARVLSEHALQTGQAFQPPQLIGSDRELRDELAADLWRVYGADPESTELLHALWNGPDALAQDLGVLLRAPVLMPPRPDAAPDPLPGLEHAFDALCGVFAQHGPQARSDLDAAIAAKHIDGRKARAPSYQKAWDALASGLAGRCLGSGDAHLDKLTPARLRECAKSGCEDKLPASPLFDALAGWFDAERKRRQWLADQSLVLLHRIREDAVGRLAKLKRERRVQGYDDLIDGVADALDGPRGGELARQLRAQYAVALVDEFQDTDARQWAIFRRVFGAVATFGRDADSNADTDISDGPVTAPALFLIGDPKQAIYGFRGGDVHTYLAASRDAVMAPPLAYNFRSRPGVLRAIEALYAQAGEHAFVDSGIHFRKVAPGAGSDDADYCRNGHPAPALSVRMLPPTSDGKPYKSDESRALATRACVAEIHAVLGDARAGNALLKQRPVQPGDIAVLVRSHAEAARMQAALVGAGVPAVAAGRQSLFQSGQAGELLALLEALLHPADESRLRAALATVLLGVDGAGIDRLDHDDSWRQHHQMQALAWRERWQRHGALALVSDLCAAHAERLLGLVDGERRLTNLMQLGELLQEADARALGMHGQVDWLRGRIAEADPNDETQLLRLESDARRVQILTLHKSKGLEFPLVFLPFAGIGKQGSNSMRHCEVPGEGGRVLHWRAGKDDDSPRWQQAVDDWAREQRAEDARLLYVGLTRAKHALWLACGPLFQAAATPLAPMLADLDALRRHVDIVVDDDALAGTLAPLPPQTADAVPPAREVHRTLPRDWWVYSFTQLSKADAGAADAARAASIADEHGADDEAASDALLPAADEAVDFDIRFSGSRFGNVLHDALEHVDFNAWCDWRGGSAPDGQAEPLRAALRAGGYPQADLDDGVAALTSLVGRTLTVQLSEGGRLCELPPPARRAELEFHFALQPTSVDALLAILHAHGVVAGRHAFGARRQLEGLMTGKIDLTYTREGRWYLLDYKSNRLPGYDAASLERAMAHSEYDLQALVYTVALHRWLRFRLGADYDYERDFGGARYLFCRGLEVGTATGIHGSRAPAELVDALDALFDGVAVSGAPA